MASDFMSVNTGALDEHARQLAAQGEEVRRAYERFRDALAAAGTPWGEGDEYAKAFTGWYTSASGQLQDGLKAVADAVGQAGSSVEQASSNYVKSDRSAE
jgi:uncharacterized protein YukE